MGKSLFDLNFFLHLNEVVKSLLFFYITEEGNAIVYIKESVG